jgi:hypothetical protein
LLPIEKTPADSPSEIDELVHAGDELIRRAKEIAQESESRLRKALGDTEPHNVLPADPTDEAPPVAYWVQHG